MATSRMGTFRFWWWENRESLCCPPSGDMMHRVACSQFASCDRRQSGKITVSISSLFSGAGRQMSDHHKIVLQLRAELKELRQRLADLEAKDERELRRSEAKWRSVISNAPIFFALVDRAGTITYLNHAQPGLTVDQSLGKSVFDFTQRAYHAILRECLAAAFEQGKTGFFHSIAAGPSGRDSCYESHVAPVTVDGEVVAASFIAADITDRKNAEQQLSRERNRAQEYLDIAAVILVVLDKHGNITLLNRRGHELLQYPEHELVGKNWFETCVPERERQRVMSAFYRLMAGDLEPTEYFENSIVASSGEERMIAWHNTLLTNEAGRRIGTLSSGTDITLRRSAEQALEQAHRELELRVTQRTAELTDANERLTREIEERRIAEEQLRVIYDGMVDGLLIADIATKRLVRANPSVAEMLGYSAQELTSMTVTDIHPADALSDVLERFHALAEGRIIKADSMPVLRKDGSVFYADITASLIVYGGSPCMIGFFRDMTERKEAQEALGREHRVLRELLKSQDRERQLIAYEIHDGLAQQLVGSIMQCETVRSLKDRNPAEANRRCDEGLDMLRRSLAETRRLISGLRPPVLDELGVLAAIGHMVRDITAAGGPEIDYRSDVKFERLEPSLENAIYRVVQECLTNAHRYSRSSKVLIELIQDHGHLRIKVTDWGVGFDPSVKREGSFGLEGVRERARLLGGHATVSSVPGEGTQINVELPLAAGE